MGNIIESSKQASNIIAQPSDIVQSLFYLNGYRLKINPLTMRHLYPIYNGTSRSNLLKFGRQTHKSTTLGYRLLLPILMIHSYKALYVSPSGNQTSVFSTDKIDSAILDSPIIKNNFFNSKTKNQVSYKEFANKSKLYLRSAFLNADGSRGISADMVVFDEIQDLLSSVLPVIEQCMGAAIGRWAQRVEFEPSLPEHYFNNKMYAGTPKTSDNVLESYWEVSSQAEWIIKCTHCNKSNILGLENIGTNCLICNKCGKPIHYCNGDWVEMNSGAIISGYRMPQIALDWVNNDKAWVEQVIKPIESGVYTTEKVYNEILALPYASSKHPLTTADMKSASASDRNMINEDDDEAIRKIALEYDLVAGIDWGKGDTMSGSSYSVLTIGYFDGNVFKVVFIRRFTGRLSDALLQLDEIIRLVNLFNVSLTIADNGDGRTSNAVMVEALGSSKFGECYEHGSMKNIIKWDPDKCIYIVSRTQMMTDLFMEIKNNKTEFFNYEEMKEFKSDFTVIHTEYSEQTRQTRYDHKGKPDDAFHSFMFARIAGGVLRGEWSEFLN